MTPALFVASLLSAALWAATPAPASSHVRGLDTPRTIQTASLGQSPTSPGGERKRVCQVQETFAALWTRDPGIIGAPDLEVRRIERGVKPSGACADDFSGRRVVKREMSANVPVGIVGGYLVLVYPDGAGVNTSLEVMDMTDGQLVRKVEFNWEKGVDFKRSAASIVATYWMALGTLPCVPLPESKECWKRIVEARGDLPLTKVPAPDCGPALKTWRWKTAPTPNELQIAVKVRDAIGSSSLEVMPVAPTCDFAD